MAKSLLDILNTGYGVLNPEHVSLSGKNYNKKESGFFDLAVGTITNVMAHSKAATKGPMVGICLRNEGRVSESGWIDETCWAAVSTQIVEEGSEMDLVQIRVRVPELHGMLDIPKDLPNRFVTDKNHDIINQYPVFVSQFSSVMEPVAGDLVWITFQNKDSQQGGIFLGVAEANSYSATSTGEEDDSSGAFRKKKKKTKVKGGVGFKKGIFTKILEYSDDKFPYAVLKKPDAPGNYEFIPDTPFNEDIIAAAKDNDLPVALLFAMIKVESNFNPKAVSSSGAAGLSQMLKMNYKPGGGKSQKYKHDPFDPKQSIKAGAKKLSYHITDRKGNVVLALHDYNRGRGTTNALKEKGKPPKEGGQDLLLSKWQGVVAIKRTKYNLTGNPTYSEKILWYYEAYEFGSVS